MADKGDFTPREMEIMAKAWNCMTEEPKVDYKKLAEACEMTNPRSASNAWANIKKKIMAKGGISATDGGAGGEKTPKSATPKATPKKRTKKAQADDGDDAEDTPAKKVKGGKKKKAKEEVVEEDEVEDGSPVKQEDDGDDMTG